MVQEPHSFQYQSPVSQEAATIEQLAPAVEALLPAMERFLRFDEPEQTAQQQSWESVLDEPLPSEGAGADVVLALLRDVIIPNGLRNGAPGFCGWVTTMPTTIPAVANFAASIAGSQRRWLQSFNTLEMIALRWLADLLELPSSYQGIFTSGGSIANLLGLGAARQAALEQRGFDCAQVGISLLPQPRIYTSIEAHHVVYRAAAVLGLGRDSVITIPTDDALRINVAALNHQLEKDVAVGATPVAVVANAGTVNTGAIDPIQDIATICKKYNVWLHIDGAYGLPGRLDPRLTALYGDLTVADSLVMDPHKWLAVPVGCGAVFVRDKELFERAFTLQPAAYMEGSLPIYSDEGPYTSQFDHFGYPFNNFGIELSAPSRGVQVWALLKEIGTEGIRARICAHNFYARHLAERVQASPFLELMAPVTLSICCFRYIPTELQGRSDDETLRILNYLNRTVLMHVRARGRCIPSATTVHGAFVIRSCYINPRTTMAEVDALADEVEQCGHEIWHKLSTQ
jgi:aromatic-L-amino-acid/L-tryptophan decarboxylase